MKQLEIILTDGNKVELSSSIIGSLPWNENVKCKDFDVAQELNSKNISACVTVNDGEKDHLFISLGNKTSDIKWLSSPNWIHVPYQEQDKDSLEITKAFLTETSSWQYIVVDKVKDKSSSNKLVSRYYISKDNTSWQYVWNKHDLSIDLQIDNYQSHLWRASWEYIDGIYTSWNIDWQAQFIYTPLYNVWGKWAPSPSRLSLPDNSLPDSIAPCRNKNDDSTDLFATSWSCLYYFSSDNQTDESTANLMFSNELLEWTKKLFAHKHNSRVTVWGLNKYDQFFYTTCDSSGLPSKKSDKKKKKGSNKEEK